MYYERLNEGIPLCDNAYVILKDKLLPTNVHVYPFCFSKRLICEEMIEIAEWCDDNLKDDYLIGYRISGFVNKIDAVAFKLRWM